MSWHRKLPNQAACGSCCGIKEKLQTLWDRTINSILRINQVEPDDQGNIRIRSDSEALTITEGTNEIVLNLDTSELPAGAVQSVNGQTGAVVLDGDDIELIQGGVVSVANAVITNGQRLATLQGDLNTEISNRQTADNTLQSNINALQASIPQEAADAVAADPTVQSFAAAAAAIPDKVDKRTGAGLRAYTHTGSTQDDTIIEDSTNGATIPIRDANGRLHAADPAAGATDKTLVTANWVSQTGDNGPNNVLHKGGNETVTSTKTFIVKQNLPNIGKQSNNIFLNVTHTWNEIIRITNVNSTSTILINLTGTTTTNPSISYAKILVKLTSPTTAIAIWLMRKNYVSNGFFTNPASFVFTISGNTLSLFTSLPSLRLNATIESNILQGVPQSPNNSLIWNEIPNRIETDTLSDPISIVDAAY